MKNSWSFGPEIEEKYGEILQYDRTEIDNPDRHFHHRINYLDRIRTVISIVQRYFPNPGNVKVGDFGCAQGNASLSLAEAGYEVYAVDINPAYIEYSKLKYERGKIEWIVGNVETLAFPADFLDVAILAEIIEHCAYSERIVEKAMYHVRPGAYLIITTPNGSRIHRNKVPTLNQILEKGDRKSLEAKQFQDDHLFEMCRDELKYILPPNAAVVESGFCYGMILWTRRSQPFMRLIPLPFIERLTRALAKIPGLNQALSYSWYVVLQKEPDTRQRSFCQKHV